MAYRQPGVQVIQDFINALPALATFSLPNVVVGPTFNVQTLESTGSGNYVGLTDTYSYPNYLLGSYIDTRPLDPTDLTSFPVTINLANTIVQLLTSTVGAVLIGNLNQFTDATVNEFANILVNDVIVITGSGVAESQSFTTVADVAGSLNSTYLNGLYDGLGNGFYIWYNINSLGVDPAVPGMTGIMVASATNDSANTIATNTAVAVSAAGGGLEFTSTALGAVVTVTNQNKGAVAGLIVNGAASPAFTAFTNIVPGVAVNDGNYTVRSVVSANVLQTNETFEGAATGITYSILRNIGLNPASPYVNIPSSTIGVVINQTGVTLPGGLTTTYAPFGSVMIVKADVVLSYRSLRFDFSADMTEFSDIPSLQAAFGTDQIVPENTAVFGVYVALLVSPTSTNLLALPLDYLNTGGGSGDELLAYGVALEILALNDIYAIAVMTQNTSVHTALQAHVDLYSQPQEMLERVGIINRQIVLTSVVLSPLTDGAVDATGLVFTSLTADFLTSGVVPGQFLQITAPTPQAGSYQIASVDSQTQVHLLPVANGGTIVPGGPVTGITFSVFRNLAKNEQAAIIAAYASSLADRRMVLTWPDVVNFPVGNAIRPIPGYFLNPAVGALTTGLPTQQGLTNLDVAAFTGVVHSTKYFSNDDLNTIAGGGVMIFVQTVLNQTPLFVRHQLTTDTSAIKFQEYSITKNVDFVSKFVRNAHKQFIGQYNIVAGTFDDLKTNAKGLINFLVENTVLPKIGGVLNSGVLSSIVQDPSNIDSILETWALDIPIPLNNLTITLVV